MSLLRAGVGNVIWTTSQMCKASTFVREAPSSDFERRREKEKKWL